MHFIMRCRLDILLLTLVQDVFKPETNILDMGHSYKVKLLIRTAKYVMETASGVSVDDRIQSRNILRKSG